MSPAPAISGGTGQAGRDGLMVCVPPGAPHQVADCSGPVTQARPGAQAGSTTHLKSTAPAADRSSRTSTTIVVRGVRGDVAGFEGGRHETVRAGDSPVLAMHVGPSAPSFRRQDLSVP